MAYAVILVRWWKLAEIGHEGIMPGNGLVIKKLSPWCLVDFIDIVIRKHGSSSDIVLH